MNSQAEQLCNQYVKHIPRMVRHIIGAKHTSLCYEDLESEAGITLLRASQQWKPNTGTAFSSYLMRAVHNSCIDVVRHSKTGISGHFEHIDFFGEETRDYADRGPSVVNQVADRVAYERCLSLIAMLPPRQKQVMTLRYINDYSETEIAEQLEFSRRVISTTIHRAKKKLIERAKEQEIQ